MHAESYTIIGVSLQDTISGTTFLYHHELNYDLCSGHTRSALALLVTTYFQVKRTTVSKLETGSLSETIVVSCPCKSSPNSSWSGARKVQCYRKAQC